MALTKNYGEKRAVDEISFTIRPGVVTGFLGPNGSGKSTTMRLILGLDAPTSDDVRVNEMIDLVGLHDVARKRAGQFALGMGQRLGIAAALSNFAGHSRNTGFTSTVTRRDAYVALLHNDEGCVA